MMQEEGQVTGHGKEGVWVETQRRSTCGACNARSSCGSGLLSQFSCRKPHRVLIHVPAGEDLPMVGERVVISIDESAFLRSAGLLYGLPLVSGMLGASLPSSWRAPAPWRCRWASRSHWRRA